MKTKYLPLPVAALIYLFTADHPACAQVWTLTGAPSEKWYAVASSADGSNLVASANSAGLLYTSRDGGANWTPTGAPAIGWGPVASSADGATLLAVGFTGSAYPIYTSTDSGANWTLTCPVPLMQ